MAPFYDIIYLLNALILGEDPTTEDFILLIGTIVATVAFVLWCCFPVSPKDPKASIHYDSRGHGHHKKHELSYNYE